MGVLKWGDSGVIKQRKKDRRNRYMHIVVMDAHTKKIIFENQMEFKTKQVSHCVQPLFAVLK